MEQGDIILVEVNGQYEFAHVKEIHEPREHPSRNHRLIAIETMSGRHLGGPMEDNVLIVDGESYPLQKAGTYVTGYADACDHFGY